MDPTVHDRWQDQQETTGRDDFDALFAQLESDDAVAPLDGGFRRLVQSMSAIRVAPPACR